MTHIQEESDFSKYLVMVRNAATLPEFLKNAEEKWLETHTGVVSRVGRPSQQKRVFTVLWQDQKAGQLKGEPSQGKLIRLVREHLSGEPLSDDAIRRYVRMWKMLQRNGKETPDFKLPAADLQFFNKHAPRYMKTLRE